MFHSLRKPGQATRKSISNGFHTDFMELRVNCRRWKVLKPPFPPKDIKVCKNEQKEGQNGLESRNFSAHQIANGKRIILSTENAQKVHPGPRFRITDWNTYYHKDS